MWIETDKKKETEIMDALGVNSYNRLEGGLVNSVYRIERNGETGVLKLASHTEDPWKISKERNVLHTLEDIGDTPKLIDTGYISELDVDFNIISLLPGFLLLRQPNEVSPETYFQIGERLAQIHSISCCDTNCGFYYDDNNIGLDPRVHNSFPGPYENSFDQQFIPARGWVGHLVSKGSRCSAEITRLLEIMEECKGAFKDHEICYNHGDHRLKNILAIQNRLTGIVDFDSFRVGDPSYDVQVFLQDSEENKVFENSRQQFLLGYRSVRDLPSGIDEKDRFYRAFIGIQKVIARGFFLRDIPKKQHEAYKEALRDELVELVENLS